MTLTTTADAEVPALSHAERQVKASSIVIGKITSIKAWRTPTNGGYIQHRRLNLLVRAGDWIKGYPHTEVSDVSTSVHCWTSHTNTYGPQGHSSYGLKAKDLKVGMCCRFYMTREAKLHNDEGAFWELLLPNGFELIPRDWGRLFISTNNYDVSVMLPQLPDDTSTVIVSEDEKMAQFRLILSAGDKPGHSARVLDGKISIPTTQAGTNAFASLSTLIAETCTMSDFGTLTPGDSETITVRQAELVKNGGHVCLLLVPLPDGTGIILGYRVPQSASYNLSAERAAFFHSLRVTAKSDLVPDKPIQLHKWIYRLPDLSKASSNP